MAASLNGVFASDTQELIKKSKVFVVGAGGIGCEVLKNLVLCGFPDIEIIDLDTIDTSNLNRQFLFHKEHVGKSKAVVAKESALKFNPDVKITAYHDSIFDTQFGVNFFKKFNVVLSALDNRQARNHVNRMCLNAQVPLIESGTAGYHGQVELIQKGVTQCYECMPKATQKTFPACTIRNTPSELIHCIVWAKHLFNQLFGESSEGEDISPDMADPEQGDSAALGKEDEVRVSTRQWAIDAKYDPHKLFNKFFSNDIKYLLAMANLWKTRKPPKAIEWGSTLLDGVDKLNVNDFLKDHHRIWTFVENAAIFADCVRKLKSRMDESPAEGEKLAWDKDDTIAMDFVASCANIRAFVFDIGQNSRFEIKSMAGNIIPAIATTNAITAGMSVLMAFKVLKNDIQNCGSIYVRNRLNPRNQYITPENFLVKPNPSCYVCSQDPAIHLKVDTEKVKLKELRDQILKNTLNMVNPDVIIDTKGIIVISSEDGETESNDNKTLKEMAIVDGVILNVDDFFQNYELRIIIVHMNSERDGPLFEVVADPSQLKPEKESSKASKRPAVDVIEDGPSTSKRFRVEVIEDDDDIEIIEDDNQDETPTPTPNPSSSKATKRKPAQEENGSPNGPSSTKRAKRTEVAEDDDDDVTIIE